MATTDEKKDGISHIHKDVAVAAEVAAGSDLVTALAKQDTRPWWQKPNLRYLYLMMFPSCMGVEYTSGFDSSMMNGIQTIEPWETCKFSIPRRN